MSSNEDQILSKASQSFDPPARVKDNAWISAEDYQKMYARSIKDPEGFWGEIAEQELHWFQKWDKVREWNREKYEYKWFINGKLNITYNCLDRHVNNGRGHRIAFHYINEDNEEETITYAQLLEQVSRCANGLKSLGVKKGDRVSIYMPMMVEQVVAILACARIGAIHSVVYAGFSAQALRLRIEDADCETVICATYTKRRGKKLDLKEIVDEAVDGLDIVKNIVVAQRTGDNLEMKAREVDFNNLLKKQSADCPAEPMDSEDPLFILYTSGTTGKPKGVLHTTGGYNLFTHYTTQISFNLHDDDIFWCTADAGWITGHSYIIYGPLSVGTTSVIAEGAPTYPDSGRWWSLVDKYKVTAFYTAPTAIRLFMKLGNEWPAKYDLSSLRVLGSVGEPINPEAWIWYHDHIGRKKCAVVDTWWQTETGGHMIVTLPSMTQIPGKAGKPFFGVQADVVNRKGEPVEPDTVGLLAIREPWPSALRTCWGEPERFRFYWNQIEGMYMPGDLATKDREGNIMILGRADDVINVSGHRIGTAEVESALITHKAVAEGAVIPKPHDVKGQSIKAFIIIKDGYETSDNLVQAIKDAVRKELGSIAIPDEIEFVDKLPKTRSGKIMRRVLKAKEMGTEVGDTSTLED
ncbi:MAG: acetate--CoA ligase [Bacteroidia bacterium]